MQDGWIKMMSFSRPEEAHVLRSKLESEGIESFIANEHTARMDFFLTQAVGNIQLWVHEEDAEKVRAILELPAPDVSEVKESTPSCPQCSSSETHFSKGPTLLTTVFFYFGIPLPFFKRGWTCRKCGHHFAA
jgi:Putative prokaryotic signal transducing protein